MQSQPQKILKTRSMRSSLHSESNKRSSSRAQKQSNLITNYLHSNTSSLRINFMKSTKPKTKKHSKRKSKRLKSKKTKKSKVETPVIHHWTPLSKSVLFQSLSRSKFRSKFKLGLKEIQIVHAKQCDLEGHTFDFVTKRLSAAYPINDGKQTPMRGHPVFIAQHATATCCRSCLSKWHHIGIGTSLSKEQIIYMVEVILYWIELKCTKKEVKW